MKRREFLKAVAAGTIWMPGATVGPFGKRDAGRGGKARAPNVVFVFADQWRAQATGYAGDPNVLTPNLDSLAKESINFTHAVSCCPVCSPYRASLMTGQYPLTHGVFLNDVYLRSDVVSIAEMFNEAGYETGYIGKWHLDGHGRTNFTPPERRQGFQFWKAVECTHRYNDSCYYADENEKLIWDGYDAIAQTREAQRYIRDHTGGKPFALFLSWGPPHNPYYTAPEEFQQLYSADDIVLRPNVPERRAESARKDLAGYYAHCSALDMCVGDILTTLKEEGIEDDTVFVFTADHGDMLGSQGESRKQRPWDESIRVPFLLRYPAQFGQRCTVIDWPLSSPDIMPTLLGLCGIEPPATVEGTDLAGVLMGEGKPKDEAALIACYAPFGEWTRAVGGREYRGVRTTRYTYVRDLNGPWLLYDNREDPYQLNNRCDDPHHADVRAHLEGILERKLELTRDSFLRGEEYVKKWGYVTDENGTVPYKP